MKRGKGGGLKVMILVCDFWGVEVYVRDLESRCLVINWICWFGGGEWGLGIRVYVGELLVLRW